AGLRDAVGGEAIVAILLGRESGRLHGAQIGVMAAGAAYLCLEPTMPDERLRLLLEDSSPVRVLTDAAGLRRARRLASDPTTVIDVATLPSVHDQLPRPPWLGSDTLAYVIYTSGTTGKPKGVLIEHRGIANLVASDLERFDLGPGDRCSQNSSAAYDSSVEETWLALSCGATLVVEKIFGVRSLGVRWLLHAGDAHDKKNKQGRATMWSELLLRGAGELDSHAQADAFDLLGASRSADNSRLFMRLGGTMLGDRFHDAAPLLVEMARRPRFDADGIEPTRELCLQSLASLRDDPQQRCVFAARARHYPTPLNRSGMGDEPGLRSLTRDDLAAGWEAHARPEGSIIAIAGAIEPDQARGSIESLLQDWSGAAPGYETGPDAPRGYAHESDDSSQVQIVVVHDAPREPRDEVILEKLLVSVLSGGMSSRLFTEVREKRGLCYSVNASYSASKETGTVTAYVGTTPERAQESLDVLCSEMDRINGDAPITPDEFRRAVTGMKSRIVFSGESTGARASSLAADIHNLGRARSLAEITERVDTVTLDQLNEYAAKRSMGSMTIQTLGPDELNPPVV
ncbi:MAG: AMP-binding protein, partial [Phycisphaerales bacterium]|nr:AMP-binding protein [Phycisphaerales bacterium]